VKDVRQHIKNVLVEENQNKKVNLVKRMIYDLFDEVSFIEQSTYDKKPLLRIYFNSDDPAANIESWFAETIYREIYEMTSGKVVVCPYWMFSWDSRKKEADIFIDTELLKYDEDGNVINESEENKNVSTGYRPKIKKPIKFFYENFLNEEPIEYKGIILQPTYNEEYDVITWEIENPEDYSFNGELLKELATNEFRDFCSLTGLDFYKLVKKINVITNMPNGWCYLNKKDNDFVENNFKNKKTIEFSVHDYEFYLNFNYRRNEIEIHSDTITFYTIGDVDGFKVDVKTKEKTKINRYFIQELNEHQYEDFRDWQYDDFYYEIMEYLRQNPRFYESRVDMFDLQLELRYKTSI